MQFPRIYIDEPLPDGYDGTIRVLANMTTKEVQAWYGASLGVPGCEACTEGGRCPSCTAARQAFGEMASLIYGPKLFDTDISTPAAALAFFDMDDVIPSELVSWLFILPDSIRLRRTETIRKNARSSSGATEN